MVCACKFPIVGGLPRFAINPVRFRALRLSIGNPSLLHFRPFTEWRCRSVLSSVCLCDRASRKLDETGMDAVAFARRSRTARRQLAIIDKRTGVFQPVQFLPSTSDSINPVIYFRLRFRVGKPLRFVLAKRRSSFRLIDLYIRRDAPRSEDFDRRPRLAESAAPAAICCLFDFAGITTLFRACAPKWTR